MKNAMRLCASLLLLAACQQAPQVDLEAEKQALMETSRQWARSQSNEEYLSFWAESATVALEGQPTYHGHAEIMGMLEGATDVPGFHITWEPYEARIAASGDLGYLLERTTFTMNDSLGNPMVTRYRTTTIWEKQEDGQWKCVVDTYTSEVE